MGLFDKWFKEDAAPTTPSAKGAEKPATLTPVGSSATSGPPIVLATPTVPPKVPKTAYEYAAPFIQKYETFQPEAYLDTNGKWAIGYGQQYIDDKPVVKGMKMTQEEAKDKFKTEYDRRRKQLDIYPNVANMTPAMEARLMDVIWNADASKINEWPIIKGILTSKDKAKLKELDKELLTIRKGRVNGKLVIMPGLENRRKASQIEMKDE